MSNTVAVVKSDDGVTLYTDSYYRFYAIDMVYDGLATYEDLGFVGCGKPNILYSALIGAKQFYKGKLDNDFKKVMKAFMSEICDRFCLFITDGKNVECLHQNGDAYIKEGVVFEGYNRTEAKAHFEAYIDINEGKVEEGVKYALSKVSPNGKIESLYIPKK